MEIVDINKFSQKLPRITSSKIYTRKSFFKDGIFSQQIFGPIHDYTCECGIKDTTNIGHRCPNCGVKYVASSERRYSYATIDMPVKILHPLVYLSIKSRRSNFKTLLEDILNGYKFYEYDESKDTFITLDEVIDVSIDDFYNIIEKLIMKIDNRMYTLLKNTIGSIFVKNIIVTPPDTRPVVISKTNDIIMDEMNYKYRDILTKIDQYNILINPEKSMYINYDFTLNIWKDTFALYDMAEEYINGDKKKLIRKNIMGKSIDFSGRAVISVDPTLKLDECGVSYKILLEIFKPELIKDLISSGFCCTMHEADSMIKDALDDKIDLFDQIKKVCTHQIVILNRAPTLHRQSLFAFKAIPTKDKVIHLHPLMCEPYNADFDGDQMAIYRPILQKSIDECKRYMIPSQNLLSPSTGSFTFVPSQTIIYGLHQLTKIGNLPFQQLIDYEYNGEIIKTTEGRIKFNSFLPPEYRFINEDVGKKTIMKLLNSIALKYTNENVSTFVDMIKEIGYEYSTYYPADVSIDNFYVDETSYDERKTKIFTSKTPIDNIRREEAELEKLKSKFKLKEMIETSSRGDWLQAKQIFLCRGHVSDYNGVFIKTPIIHNFVEGLTAYEHFLSCYGTRKGLIDTSINTSKSGYLSRQFVYVLSSAMIDYNLKDCGSKNGIEYDVTEENFKQLYGRYVIEKDGSVRLISKNDIGSTVTLRSPIRCKGDNICLTCYGDTAKYIKSRMVGIIAAQTLGEISTQNTLRTFHTSGAAQIGESDDQEDIISDMKKISSALSGKISNHKDMIKVLNSTYGSYKPIQFIHNEILVSQLLWSVVDNKMVLWRKLEDNVEYKALSKMVAIAIHSPLLGYIFSAGKSDLYKMLLSKKSNNILVKFLYNELEEAKHDL